MISKTERGWWLRGLGRKLKTEVIGRQLKKDEPGNYDITQEWECRWGFTLMFHLKDDNAALPQNRGENARQDNEAHGRRKSCQQKQRGRVQTSEIGRPKAGDLWWWDRSRIGETAPGATLDLPRCFRSSGCEPKNRWTSEESQIWTGRDSREKIPYQAFHKD